MSSHRATDAARATARTAGRHPLEALSLVGVAAGAAAVVGVVAVVRAVRSRRLRRRLQSSAKHGAFGPGVAAATNLADYAERRRSS